MNRTLLPLLVCVLVIGIGAVAQNESSAPTSPGAQVRLGNTYLEKKDYSSAMVWFRKAAAQGNAVAQNNVGWLYESGFGVSRDYAEALNWFSKAATQGNADAENNIGWLYQNGWAVKQDYAQAITWYRKAADQGNTRAEENIGSFYEKGLGVKQDFPGSNGLVPQSCGSRKYKRPGERGMALPARLGNEARLR